MEEHGVSKIVSVKFHKANETVSLGEARPLVPMAAPIMTSTTNSNGDSEGSQVTASPATEQAVQSEVPAHETVESPESA